ncbi:ABC transporter, substrate-binding protein (cluster 1, maltose/g3p/polyamine/iron) [Azospirillum argentinense]|uniref:Putative spermidine/putrescine transport system substrate-binding protein n=1 Tax=Azospirillum brasilense TaxID=192 RepID=A0A560C605_AZOBR|nr:extracellular solute-binding protein [Azospirillum brasilense]MBK3733347.1 extracellular solute-binding protein [Azospirillum brasilense]TWA80285.1 putative spermidine/putrescine transport system substrate-binding protein [Azospirillum brasilense]
MNETTGKQGLHAALTGGIGRRAVLAGAGTLATVAAIGFPNIVRAQSKTLKVGVYGGYFKESFEKHIFPEFSKATGITVEAIAEPTGEAWLVQLEQAARARQAPADVSMMSQVAMLKGASAELWAPFDLSKIPNAAKVVPHLVNKYPDGKVSGIGAVSWYITLVTNTKSYPQAPDSWAALWDPANKDKLGLLALVSNSFLLEVTAATFFGGTKHLDSEQGQLDCFKKLAELKSNVKLWYRDEAQFEASLKSGEIPMGQYYHDVTGLAAADGQPVRSTFPKEGGILDSGSWAVTRASKAGDLAHVFVDYMCQPSIQALLSRKVGTAPTIDRKMTDLTDQEFAAVSSDIAPIIPRYDLYTSKSDWLNQKWTEMIVG